MNGRVTRASSRPADRGGSWRRWVLVLGALLPLLAAPETPAPAAGNAPAEGPPNVLLILIDDLGIEHLDFYGIGTDFAPTPNLGEIASAGLLFQNAWSKPVCSSTRATIQTGRYGFRTGIGENTFKKTFDEDQTQLPAEELTLPELLRLYSPTAYMSALFGKWHLGSDEAAGGLLAPNQAGYDHFSGSLAAPFGEDVYFDFDRTVDGVTSRVTDVYMTTDQIDSAIEWINGVAAPWLAVVTPFAVHQPFHWPPEDLHSQDTSEPGDVPRYRAMLEALDHEIGRLLDSIDMTNTVVIAASDNGSPQEVAVSPVKPERAKGTLYEGGIRVPLMITGPGVVPGRVDAIVNLSDLFATIAELAGAAIPQELVLDSVSLVPYLSQPDLPPLRAHVFSEIFAPNGLPPYNTRTVTARNDRYKYGRRIETGKEAMFDLWTDPWEATNVLEGRLSPEEQAAYDDLTQYLSELAGSGCSLARRGESCDVDDDCCSGRCRGNVGNRVCK